MSKLTKITAALAVLAMLISPIAHGQQSVDIADSTESINRPIGRSRSTAFRSNDRFERRHCGRFHNQ
jgi:hypothetical protein